MRMLPKARNKIAVMDNYARAASHLDYKNIEPMPVYTELQREQYIAFDFEEGGVPANVIRFNEHKFFI